MPVVSGGPSSTSTSRRDSSSPAFATLATVGTPVLDGRDGGHADKLIADAEQGGVLRQESLQTGLKKY